jgi:hypothetical protein
MFNNHVTNLVSEITLEKAVAKKPSPDLFQKAARHKPYHQIKVGSYLILLGRGGIQQVSSGCLHSLSNPFRDQNVRKPQI